MRKLEQQLSSVVALGTTLALGAACTSESAPGKEERPAVEQLVTQLGVTSLEDVTKPRFDLDCPEADEGADELTDLHVAFTTDSGRLEISDVTRYHQDTNGDGRFNFRDDHWAYCGDVVAGGDEGSIAVVPHVDGFTDEFRP